MSEPKYKNFQNNPELRERSGNVEYPSTDWLTSFLYVLIRDAAVPGEIERIVQELEVEISNLYNDCLNDKLDNHNRYTNGWLATYANDLAKRLLAIQQKCIKFEK